jgi:hypothetical protein
MVLRPDGATTEFDGRNVRVQFEDGRFTAPGLIPGRYRPVLGESPARLAVASVMVGNVDVLDFPLEIKPGDTPVGRVVLTRSTTEISGRLIGTIDPATSYSVIAFAADERYWLPDSRRNVGVETDPAGVSRSRTCRPAVIA